MPPFRHALRKKATLCETWEPISACSVFSCSPDKARRSWGRRIKSMKYRAVMARRSGLNAGKVSTSPDSAASPSSRTMVSAPRSRVMRITMLPRSGKRRASAMAKRSKPIHVPNPKVLGVEGMGRVLAVGDGVEDIEPGQRVAWVYAPGSYAERIAIPATSLVKVPDAIDDRTAASVMMQGLTAGHFVTAFYPVQAGDIAFVHAAAGGVGLLLTQIIKLRGGHVIGRVSSEEKVAVAKEAGADHVIVDTEGRFAEEALRLTRGEGVHVVYDGSGPTTFQGSLDVLRRSGTFCWHGPVLGGPGPLDIMQLPQSIRIGYPRFRDPMHM